MYPMYGTLYIYTLNIIYSIHGILCSIYMVYYVPYKWYIILIVDKKIHLFIKK